MSADPELRLCRTADVFSDNEVYTLPAAEQRRDMQLAAAAWLADGLRPKQGHRLALAAAIAQTARALPHYGVYLLAGDTVWQPSSVMVRRRGCPAGIEALGADHSVLASQTLETERGIRRFCVVRLGAEPGDAVCSVLEAEPVSALAILAPTHEPHLSVLVGAGWQRPVAGPSRELMWPIVSAGGLLVVLVGAFDDRESGCVAFGSDRVVSKLCGSA